jgi:hypothetical protein
LFERFISAQGRRDLLGLEAAERHRKKKDKELIYFHIRQDDLCS